jgi:hypothetical protein
MDAPCGTISLNVLVDCPQRGSEDPLKFTPLIIAEFANIGIHGVDPKPRESLRPIVSQGTQADSSPAAWRGVFGEPETPSIVIVLHAVLPPIDRDLLTTMGTSDPLKVRSAVKELDLIRQFDLNPVRMGSDPTKQGQRSLVSGGIRHEARVLRDNCYPVVGHGG